MLPRVNFVYFKIFFYQPKLISPQLYVYPPHTLRMLIGRFWDTEHMPNISVAADFTNAAVAAAQNPSNAGYHHGEHILTIG
jgi:hypothetical protein